MAIDRCATDVVRVIGLPVKPGSSSAAAAEWLFFAGPKKSHQKKRPSLHINPATGLTFGIFVLAIHGSVRKRRASMRAALRVWVACWLFKNEERTAAAPFLAVDEHRRISRKNNSNVMDPSPAEARPVLSRSKAE